MKQFECANFEALRKMRAPQVGGAGGVAGSIFGPPRDCESPASRDDNNFCSWGDGNSRVVDLWPLAEQNVGTAHFVALNSTRPDIQ